MNKDKTTRELAIEWWNKQDDYYKGMQFRQYQKEHFTPATDYGLLTGREIEKIYLDIKLSERAIPEHPQTEEQVKEVGIMKENKRLKEVNKLLVDALENIGYSINAAPSMDLLVDKLKDKAKAALKEANPIK